MSTQFLLAGIVALQGGSPKDYLLLAVPWIVLFGFLYFLVFMPAQRRQKQMQHLLSELKSGDKIITNGGIYGTIVGVEGDAVQLRIAEQVKIKVARSAIAGKQPEATESK